MIDLLYTPLLVCGLIGGEPYAITERELFPLSGANFHRQEEYCEVRNRSGKRICTKEQMTKGYFITIMAKGYSSRVFRSDAPMKTPLLDVVNACIFP